MVLLGVVIVGGVSQQRFLTTANTVAKTTLLGPLSRMTTGTIRGPGITKGGLHLTVINANKENASV